MLHPGNAMELALKALLYAEFANVFRAPVVGLVVVVFNGFFFAGIDAPDVANHMAGQLAIRIVAKQARLDLHARKAKALRGKTRHLGIGQAVANGQGLEVFGLAHQLLETAPVARADLYQLGQGVDGGLQRPRFGGRDLQRVGRIVARQHDAIAVFDQTPVGHDGHDGGAVALGLGAQIVVAPDLQVHQAAQQQKKARQHQHGEHKDAGPKPGQVRFYVAQFHGLVAARADGFRPGRARGAAARAAANSPAATAVPRPPARARPTSPESPRPSAG